MKNKLNIIEAAMKYKQITILITAVFVIFGAYALFVMPRQEFPEFVIRQGVVAAVMPGASAEQIENQLAVPIENYLFGFKEVNKKKTYSQSKEGIVYIFVELNENVKEPSEFWSKLKHGLNDLKPKLPSDLYGVFVNDDFGNTSAVLISMESDTKTYKELNEVSKQLESRLRKVESVSKLNRLGMQNEVINIYLQPEKLSYYGIKPMLIMMALKSEGSVAYGGVVKNDVIELPVHISSKYRTVEDIGDQTIYSDPNGNMIRIKDVATVKREMKDLESYITNNRTKCMLLSIEMLEGNNIVQFGEDVSEIISQYKKELPADIKLNQIANQPDIVSKSITSFLGEFGIAILAVIFVTMLLLPFRVAAVAGTTIPIAILITIGVLNVFGVQLDTVSLAALIIVLGMVVDNSIVVIDNYVEKLDHDTTPWEAAKRSAQDLFVPVLSATLILISCFAPLAFFMTGMGADFIKNFPITISVALISSLLVAVLLVPYMCFVLIKTGIKKPGEENEKKRKSFLDYMQAAYDKSLEIAFRYPRMMILIAVLSIVCGLLFMGVLDQELFPKMDRNQLAVEIYLPEGTALDRTDSVARKVENLLLKDQRIIDVATFVGGSSPRFHTVYAPNMPSKNYAQMIVNTTDNKTAIEVLDEYSAKYSNAYPEAYVRFKQLDMQATKAPIEIRLSGDNIRTLKLQAEKVADIFRKNDKVVWVRNDYEEAKQTIVYDINYAEATRLGYTKFDISTYLAIAQNGAPLTTLWEDDYPVGVTLTMLKDKKDVDFELNNSYVPALFMPSVIPLRQIATPRAEWTEGQIVRRNGVRTISVLVDVQRNILASSILKEEMPKLTSMKLPDNMQLSFGGEKEGESEQYPPLIKALLTAVVLIFFILLFQFRKIKTSILIMITMPLGLFGAVFGLLLLGFPFGMTSFIGLISLCGVVIRNGIILIDYINTIRTEQGLTVKEAAIAGGKRRLRPIFLTSAAAAVGVIPMIISKSLLWAPLATIISFGLLFSMALTLTTLPVLYWYTFRHEDKEKFQAKSV